MEERIKTMLPLLNEYQKRIFLASEAMSYGWGGIQKVSEISGASMNTIRRGIAERRRRAETFDGEISAYQRTHSRDCRPKDLWQSGACFVLYDLERQNYPGFAGQGLWGKNLVSFRVYAVGRNGVQPSGKRETVAGWNLSPRP